MDFKQYIKSLLPSFSKSQLAEDLDIISEELKEHTLPCYKQTVDVFGKRPLTSSQGRESDELFKKRLTTKTSPNHLKSIYDILVVCEAHVEALETLIDDKFALDINAAGLDIVRINILQMVEILGFAVRYARRHLNYMVGCEIAHYSNQSVTDSFSQGELEWLSGSRSAFIAALNILGVPKMELEKKFAQVPDVLVTADTIEAAINVVGKSEADPLELRFVPLAFNPIYHVRLRIAEYQANRYKEAQEERRSIELRLLLLRDQENGRENAKVERQIEYQEERRAKLTYKINQMEEKYVD